MSVEYRGKPQCLMPPASVFALDVESMQCLGLVSKEPMTWKQYMVHAVLSPLFYAFRWDYLLFCKHSHRIRCVAAGS